MCTCDGDDEAKTCSSFGTGLIIGGVLGLIAGILYAPQEGETTRSQVKDKLDKARGEFEHVKHQARRKAQSFSTTAQTKITNAKKSIKKQLTDKAERDSI
jgi:gas vesicle protein